MNEPKKNDHWVKNLFHTFTLNKYVTHTVSNILTKKGPIYRRIKPESHLNLVRIR